MNKDRWVEFNNRKYLVEADFTTKGTYLSLVTPPGRYIREPDVQTTDANTGNTTVTIGRVVEFDTADGALDAGEQNIKMRVAP